MRLLSMHVLSDDLDLVSSSIEQVWPERRGVAVGQAGRWIGVFPELQDPPGDWEDDASQLALVCGRWTLAIHVGARQWAVAVLHDGDGQARGRIDWQLDGEPAQRELVEVVLRRWAALLSDRIEVVDSQLGLDWADGGEFVGGLTAAMGIANVEWHFSSLIERGDLDVIGWETFCARIDGEWMQLAERRWLAPPIAPLPADVDEEDEEGIGQQATPRLSLRLGRRRIAGGEHLTASLTLSCGATPVELEDVVVRMLGVVEHRFELRRFETSLVVAQGGHVDPDMPMAVAFVLDVPRRAVPTDAGAPWRVAATANLVDGRFVTAEATFEVEGEQPRLAHVARPAATAPVEPRAVGDAAVLDDGPALVLRRASAPAVRVRYVGGLYRIEAGYEGDFEHLFEVRGSGGRYARVSEPDANGHCALEMAVRPAAHIDVARVAELVEQVAATGLGHDDADDALGQFIAEVLDPDFELGGLQRWDHIHRRALACFALSVCVGRLALHPVVEEVLEHQISSEAGYELDQRGGPAVPADDLRATRLVQLFVELTDGLGDGPLDASLGPASALGAASELEPLVDGTDAVVERATALLAQERAEDAIALIDRALAGFHVDARLYAIKGEACMSLGFDMRARYTDQVDYFEWRYPEAYRGRARALRTAAEQALRLSVWLDPTPEAAADLALLLKHPLDAVGAWERALSLAPDEPAYRVGLAESIVRAEGADPSAAVEILEGVEPPGPEASTAALRLWARVCRRLALARLRQVLAGGEPEYFQFGLVGDPSAVVVTGPLDALRAATDQLESLPECGDEASDAATRWLVDHLRHLLESFAAVGEDGAGLDVALRLADIAHGYGVEPLGRLAAAIALRGWRADRDVARLVERARVCQIVYRSDDADMLLERAELLSSRPLLPVLEAQLDVLRARGEADAARTVLERIVEIAPEQVARARQVFDAHIEQGDLDRAEALLEFYLFAHEGHPDALDLLVEQAVRLSEVYVVMDDVAGALRPLEWVVFGAGEALDERQREALDARCVSIRERTAVMWQARDWADEDDEDEEDDLSAELAIVDFEPGDDDDDDDDESD